MTLLDWALLLVWLGVTLSGFWKGAVRIVFGLGGFLGGLFLAVAAGAGFAARLREGLGWGWPADVIGRVAPVLLCVGLGFAAGWGLERTLQALHLSWLNRLAGAALAALLAALLLGAVLALGSQMSPTWCDVCARSKIATVLMKVPALVFPPAHPPGEVSR
ncbi:MAG: CvpA family protein [Acidobacteria bacterium]|jgi:uncharacterized membrane protein required for colicin V production|nr:CvpA family protein [Acidobacteriota bacterium]